MLRGDSIECAHTSVGKTILDQWGTLFRGEGKVRFMYDSVDTTFVGVRSLLKVNLVVW